MKRKNNVMHYIKITIYTDDAHYGLMEYTP